MDQATGIPQLQVQIDRQAAARYGVSVADDLRDRAARGRRRGADPGLEEPAQLRGLRALPGRDARRPRRRSATCWWIPRRAAQIPLSQVAQVTLSEGPNVIWREAMNRRLSIDAEHPGPRPRQRGLGHQEGPDEGRTAEGLLRRLRRAVPEPAAGDEVAAAGDGDRAGGRVHAALRGAEFGVAGADHPGDRAQRVHRRSGLAAAHRRDAQRLLGGRVHRALRDRGAEQPGAADSDEGLHRRRGTPGIRRSGWRASSGCGRS